MSGARCGWWWWVDWVTAHYVISTGSELTSRLNCAGDNGNLPGHSTVSPHGIFNVAATLHRVAPRRAALYVLQPVYLALIPSVVAIPRVSP